MQVFRLIAILGAVLPASTAVAAETAFDMVEIPGGAYTMGDAAGEPDEQPRRVTVAPYSMMRHEVTNRQFARFVTESGHRTDPEKSGKGYVWRSRWRLIEGADWRHPHGPGDSAADRGEHPVLQVSARDAAAFCAHYGMRLPTDPEWEFAARGTDGRRYPWGDLAPAQDGSGLANFGTVPCCAPDETDGYRATAPVGSFPAGRSPFGLLDMAGNVWEWTSSVHPGEPGEISLRGGGWGNNPYCLRVSYRHGNPPDIGLDMVGFRCAAG